MPLRRKIPPAVFIIFWLIDCHIHNRPDLSRVTDRARGEMIDRKIEKKLQEKYVELNVQKGERTALGGKKDMPQHLGSAKPPPLLRREFCHISYSRKAMSVPCVAS